MGVLLVAGLGLLAYGVATRTGESGAKPAATAMFSAVREFGAVGVPVPAGARVEQALVVGDRVVLRISGGGDRLIVLDPAGGSVAGSFVLVPEAPAGPR